MQCGAAFTEAPPLRLALEPHLIINEADWQRIEGKYGNQLPESVRMAVLEETQKSR